MFTETCFASYESRAFVTYEEDYEYLDFYKRELEDL